MLTGFLLFNALAWLGEPRGAPMSAAAIVAAIFVNA